MSSNKELEQEVIECIRSVIKEKETKIDAGMNLFSELRIDSLSFMKLIALLEDEYDIEFDEDELMVDQSWIVNDLICLVENHVNMELRGRSNGAVNQ